MKTYQSGLSGLVTRSHITIKKDQEKIMKKRKYLLLSAALLTFTALFTTIGFATGLPPTPPPVPGTELFPAVSSSPVRTCSVTLGAGKTVDIVAGLNGDPESPFPRVVSCPGSDCPTDFSGSGLFLRWDYTFTYNGVTIPIPSESCGDKDRDNSRTPNFPYAFLSVSNDTKLYHTTPSSVIPTASCQGDSLSKAGQSTCEARFLRFNTVTNILNVAYLTSVGLSPRLATAGAKVGTTQQFCMLAGAGNQSFATINQPISESVEQIVQTAGCRVSLTRDANDRVAKAEVIEDKGGECVIEETDDPITMDGKIVVSELPRDGWATEGSCKYSYVNTIGGKTTINCPTCCVQKTTNTCVLKSNLSNPATQCTPTSLNN
ncbi:MAG: hypothetical protein ACXWT1_17900 [Methylobacter sp.]